MFVSEEVSYPSLETPVLLLDLDKLEANIREMSQLAAEAGVKLRPHIKVHSSALIAKWQIEAGANGIEVGLLDQAEAFADEGFDDILVAHPFYGRDKLEKLQRLLRKSWLKISVVVDMFEQAEAISKVGQSVGRKVPVLLKIDTCEPSRPRAARFGVPPGDPALKLAKKLCQLPHIEFMGIYAHEMGVEPTQEGVDNAAFETASIMSETARMLRREGVNVEHVSVGASTTFRSTCRLIREGRFPEITEIHPGSCIIGDMRYVNAFALTEDRCALTVLAGVISTSHPNFAVIDAGSKTLGGDPIIERHDTPGFFWEGRPSYGAIRGRPDLWLGYVSAETSCVYYKDPGMKLKLGERIEIIPNWAAIVTNLHDRMYGVRKGKIEVVIPITGRGRGT